MSAMLVHDTLSHLFCGELIIHGIDQGFHVNLKVLYVGTAQTREG